MASDNENPIRIGLLGIGTVGSETARLLIEDCEELSARVGRAIELVGVACRNPDDVDFPWLDHGLLTTDTEALCRRADIVVELFGGLEPARTMVILAMESGASVVTANKALLATYGPELYRTAAAHGVDLYFEAAVGGAIPIVHPLRESLAGDRVEWMLGIVNGTTNYILDQMTTEGLDFDVALKQAQEQGYAEADPTGDIEGEDAANKAAIMATLAFHTNVVLRDVTAEGITSITAEDIEAATAEHKVIKLLAVMENGESGVSARVYPALIDERHPLASVHGSFNAIFIHARAAGDLMFYGRGAGGAPTASAVVGDVVTEARHIAQGCTGPSIPMYLDLPKAPLDAAKAAFAVRFVIHDKPGVLAAIAREFSDHGISINGVNQDLTPTRHDPGYSGELQQLRLVTHQCDEQTLRTTVKAVQGLDFVTGTPSVLRVLA
ncbi:MAG: homoserine dehydrogenase [Bifidobacterium mongoliense]|uniref:homoserine dehydrogenase n=1 Tax=Bifidobacterium mongoliense TaxID=518643 RepID=UPI002F355A1A